MLRQLSHCTDTQLEYLLTRVREIAALGDEAALIETDKLLWEITGNGVDGEESASVEEVYGPTAGFEVMRRQRVLGFLQEFKGKIDSKTVRSHHIHWFRLSLREEVFGRHPQEEDEELAQFMAEGVAIIEEAEAVALERGLEECLTWNFKNIKSVGAMLDMLRSEVSMLWEKGLTAETQARVREIKGRGARFRWSRKQSDADVAEKAGFVGKAAGLRREAEALLVQDWAMVFPGEEPPEASLSA